MYSELDINKNVTSQINLIIVGTFHHPKLPKFQQNLIWINFNQIKSLLYSLNTLSGVTSERCPSPRLCAPTHQGCNSGELTNHHILRTNYSNSFGRNKIQMWF